MPDGSVLEGWGQQESSDFRGGSRGKVLGKGHRENLVEAVLAVGMEARYCGQWSSECDPGTSSISIYLAGCSLELQIFTPHARPTKPAILTVEPSNLWFHMPSRWF